MRTTLPAEAFSQALGHRFADNEVVSAANSGRIAEVMQPIEERLHALRMTAMRAQHTPQARRAVFEFIEALRQAGQGLNLFVGLMLEDNPFQRTPRWRGLYFAGSADAAHRGGAFVADGNLISGVGKLPFNTDGGGLCNNHPANRGGMTKVIEAVRQLRGQADARQVANAEIGVVTGWGDFGDGSIAILRR